MTRPASAAAERLFAWTPFRASWREDTLWLDWCHLDRRRMVEPFFYETIVQGMREPFNLAFQQSTPAAVLADLPAGLPIAGLIFHMSRCGSTLASQMLAAFESNIVVSEAAPLRGVLRLAERVGEQQAALWLAGLANAYAQPRFGYERRLVLKFMAADVLDIELVRRALPEVPWVFITRDPAAILASQARAGSVDVLRGRLPATRLGLDDADMWELDEADYRARVLAAFAKAGRDAVAGGKGLILDHEELPEALWTTLPAHFGLTLDAGAVAAVRGMARRHSKRPDQPFAAEHDPNRAGAAAFRTVADEIAGPVMADLAALRRAR